MKYNKLIAEFIRGYESEEFEDFHSDWNLLMLVVEKIENYNNGHTLVIIEDERCHIDTQNGYNVDTVCNKKISAVYDACCGFIEWYNNNQLNK
jgi:hypothetical protein